jgi:hypothetical protein
MEPEMDRSGSRLKKPKNSKNKLHTALDVNMRRFRRQSRRARRQRRQWEPNIVVKVERDYTAIIELLSDHDICDRGEEKQMLCKCYAQQRGKTSNSFE